MNAAHPRPESLAIAAALWAAEHGATVDCRLVLLVLAAHHDPGELPPLGWPLAELSALCGLHPASTAEACRSLSRLGAVRIAVLPHGGGLPDGGRMVFLNPAALIASPDAAPPAPPLPGNRWGRRTGRPRNPPILERNLSR
jgi:IclR helix-turn-helix domain